VVLIQIWHLSGQMAQKSCRFPGKHFLSAAAFSVQAAGSSARMPFQRRDLAAFPGCAQQHRRKQRRGNTMPSRSWFYAANGQQQGPYPEEQLQDLIARGAVRPDTLVWSEGMSGWQKAGEIPGLMARPPGPPSIPQAGGPPAYPGGYATAGTGAISIDFGIWEFVWRTLVYLIAVCFIIPIPWMVVWYTNWILSHVHVPGRPNISFTGSPLIIAAWIFGLIVLSAIAPLADMQWLNTVVAIISIVMWWLYLRWFVEKLASNGQLMGLSFSGSFWGFLGYYLLLIVSLITIIGWAWVYAAMMRWFCRNIQGTRREVVFTGTGLEILWRTLVAALVSSLIIPIPWMYRWMMRWFASQTKLVERGTLANA
jgi:hypothetical protein